MASSLNTLSERERRLLGLLAEGHTVKSAIALTGDSEYAANELLRSARRKLGVSSSREAARLWSEGASKAQEIRDTKSGIAVRAPRRQLSQGLIFGGVAMGVLVLTSASVLLLNASGASSAAVVDEGTPIVVSTSPADGSAIPPGPFTLSVTYNQPMAPGSMSFATGPNPAFPECKGQVLQSQDGKTYSIPCVAKPDRDYTVWFNYGQYQNFRSAASGRSAEPHGISFTTKN